MNVPKMFVVVSSLCIFASSYGATPVIQANFDGSPAPVSGKYTLKGEVEYTDGVQGKAIVMGDAYCQFAVDGVLTPSEGSATLWVKPMNWKWNNNEFIFFLSSISQQQSGRVILYKYMTSGLGLNFHYGIPGKTNETCIDANWDSSKLSDDQWMSLAITWSKKSKVITQYINGKPVASAKINDSMVFDKFIDFTINAPPFQPFNRAHKTAYDMLRVYNTALSEDEIARLYKAESERGLDIPLDNTKGTVFTLPCMRTPPRIDGNFVDTEWSSAARLSGFSQIINPKLEIDPHSEVYAGCDMQNIYLCFIAKIPGATHLVNKIKVRDGAVYSDDAVEVYMGPPELKAGYYQGIFNLAGTIYDSFSGNAKWNGAWEVKTGIYEGLWITEIKMPFSEINSKFQNGSVWNFNFCRDRQLEPDIIFSSVSPTHVFACRYGEMRLDKNSCYARLDLDYETLFRRKLEFKLEVKNPSENPIPVSFKVDVFASSGQVVSEEKFSATISGGASHVFEYKNPLNGFRSGIVRLDVAESGMTTVYRQDLPLVFKDEVSVSQNTNLSANTLTLEIDTNSHFAISNASEIVGCIIAKSGKRGPVTEFGGRPVAKGTFPLRSLEPGDYTIELVFKDKNGRELLRYNQYYDHIGQPLWLKEKPGEDAGVIYPYTPIQRSGNTLSVIGRTHSFSDSLLPAQIISSGVSLFAKKPTLRAKVDGKEYEVCNFLFKNVKDGGDKTIMDFTAQAGAVSFKGSVSMEYDGFIWYELALDGNGAPVSVDKLTLEIEMLPEVAEFINAHFFSRENIAGKLNPPLKLKRFPSVWIGNRDAGFTFFLESFQAWRNKNPLEAYSFEHSGKNVLWKIHFIDQRTLLSEKPLKYEFGVEANPVKPTPKNFRSWRVYGHAPYNISHPWQMDRKKVKRYPGELGFYTPLYSSLENFRDEVKRFRDQGAELSLYLNPFLVSPDATEYKIFRREWRNPYNPYPQCPGSSFTDFIVWNVNDHIQNGGLKSVYVDSLGAINCHNPEHGCGYINEKGEVSLTYPIRKMRNYVKRIYSLLHANGREQDKNFLWAHMSARTNAPLNAFVDFQASGEEMEYEMTRESNYLRLYPMDAFQVYFMKSSGVVPMFLPNLGRTGPKEARDNIKYNDEFLQLVLLHDVLLWLDLCHTKYVKNIYKKLDDFGIKDESLEFLSYRDQRIVTTDAPEVRISVYRLKDKSLAVIGNGLDEERVVNLGIAPDKLGLKNEIKLRELKSGTTLEGTTKPQVKLPPYSFILLEIAN